MNMDSNQFLKKFGESGVVILVNNLNVTINNVYEPVQEQIEQSQAHRWAGYSHPYDICECGVMTRDFASHIRQMAARTA